MNKNVNCLKVDPKSFKQIFPSMDIYEASGNPSVIFGNEIEAHSQ